MENHGEKYGAAITKLGVSIFLMSEEAIVAGIKEREKEWSRWGKD